MEFPRWLDPRRIYQDPKRLLNPLSIRGGLLYGTVADVLAEKLDLPPEQRGAITGALMAPTPALMPLGAAIGYDLNNPLNRGEEEELKKAFEKSEQLREQGVQPGSESTRGEQDTIVGRGGATAALSEAPPEPLRPGIDVDPPTSTVPPRVEPRPEQRPLTETTVPTTVAREKAPAASSPIPPVATGGNPGNEVQAVERQAASEFDRAMSQLGSFGDIKSDRLRAALQGAQEDVLRRRFG